MAGPIKGELESLMGKAEPVQPVQPVVEELKPKAPKKPKKEPRRRTLGDIYTAIEAQRMYNPAVPSVPRPIQPSPANQQKIGTAQAMDMEGGWGGPAEKKV